MRLSVTRLSLALAVLVPAMLAAQATPAAPTFRVLRVYRETVKPGKNDAHDAHENAWAGALAAAKAPTPMLAIKSMTGAPENWYMSAFPSWGDAEKADKEYAANATFTGIDKQFSAKEDEYLSDGRQMILTLRDDLSYGGPADLSSARYFSVTRISVRPGHTAEYEANRKAVKAAHESIKAPDGYSMWVAASGAPAGTYFIISPRKSLAELDRDAPIHTGAAYMAALGDSAARARMNANTAAAIVSSQTDIFSFAPQQSIPPAEWITADPGYWKHKVAAPKKTP
jgi:hypothetical protein